MVMIGLTLPPAPEAVAEVEADPWHLRIACRAPASRRVWMLALSRRGRLVAFGRGRFIDAENAIARVLLSPDLAGEDRERAEDLDRAINVWGGRSTRVIAAIRRLPEGGAWRDLDVCESVRWRRVWP